MKPYYDHAGITIYHGDCREILPEIKADAVVTDPPYGMNYVANKQTGPNSRGHKPGIKSRSHGSRVSGDKEKPSLSFVDQYQKCLVWGFHHYPEQLGAGSVLVWIKRVDTAFGSFLSDADLAWVKGGCGVYCFRDLSLQGESRYHPTEKPVLLFEYLIKTYSLTGDVVLDNCMGSGTTAEACIRSGRQFIGFEKEQSYFDAAQIRIKNAQGQGKIGAWF